MDLFQLKKLGIGDLVAIGNYDIIPNNEKQEALMWKVIDKKDGKLFVITDKLIDAFSFNYNQSKENVEDVTWENCSLRKFLNNELAKLMAPSSLISH